MSSLSLDIPVAPRLTQSSRSERPRLKETLTVYNILPQKENVQPTRKQTEPRREPPHASSSSAATQAQARPPTLDPIKVFAAVRTRVKWIYTVLDYQQGFLQPPVRLTDIYHLYLAGRPDPNGRILHALTQAMQLEGIKDSGGGMFVFSITGGETGVQWIDDVSLVRARAAIVDCWLAQAFATGDTGPRRVGEIHAALCGLWPALDDLTEMQLLRCMRMKGTNSNGGGEFALKPEIKGGKVVWWCVRYVHTGTVVA